MKGAARSYPVSGLQMSPTLRNRGSRMSVRTLLQLLAIGIALGSEPSLFAETPEIRFYAKTGSTETETTTRFPADLTVVYADGLEPGSQYLLVADTDDGQSAYESAVAFNADTKGTISTDRAKPVSGSYA